MNSPPPRGSPGRAPEVWENVPPRNRNFTGREELLAKLRASITGDVTAVVSRVEAHALHGLGGVGKTQMVVEYAWRYRAEYDLVWWIPSDQPILVRSSLAGLAPYLGLPPATTTGIEDAARAVLSALRRGEPYANWLLIFDNADQPEDIKETIPDGGPGHVLITSRNPRWQTEANAIPIDVFSRTESVQFLCKRVRGIDSKEADALAEALGDLPLALEQAGALQAETGMTVEEYLRLLKERTGQLLAEGKPTEYPDSMTAAWGLSVTSLKEKLPEAIELLRCCAYFGPEPIPRAVFNTAPAGIAPELASLLRDPIRRSRAIGELGRFALARVDAPGRTIQVHRLIQALVRDGLSPSEQERCRSDVHQILVATTPDSPDNTANWARYASLLAHVAPSALAQNRDGSVRALALNFVRYLYISGDYRSALVFVEQFEERWTADSGPDDLDVLQARVQRGIIMRELGRYNEAYEIDKATADHMDAMTQGGEAFRDARLIVLNSFGADLRARGDFIAAREHDEESVRRHEEAYGPDERRTLRAVNNLALDYGLVSLYNEARDAHGRSYQGLAPGGRGVGRADVLSSWSGLARAVRLCGVYREACDLGEEAHGFGVDELGAEHPWTLRTAKDLAIALRRAGDYDRALELALEVHARYLRLFGPNQPDSLASAMCLANIQRSMGQIDEAFELASETLKLYPAMYGSDHPYYHGCAGNLALLHRVRGEAAEARRLNERALAGLEAKLKRDHHYSLTVATNLASDLAALGDLASARQLGEGTLRRLRVVLGMDHPMALACAANLAADMKADGAEEEGTKLFEDTLDRYARVLAPNHPDALVAQEGRHLDCDFDPPPI
ncbi:FxSxx-COOH system tetratricopeptide repeat protein [Actinomadura rudentiformis]|uniref:Tetratricopeptide repeat protein n=1 Tax=Actinomadura rudentiformis TaxID=359158 RepID=A0A6H9YXX9_9ACTN|nr:FxSxx-COOH system tetratricopeptide repeat protein [Actinomadura rudentiformis]KAB2351373.1 tetratricopeptide repeat protein [Actinomadura rudentiformis]